MKQLNVFIGLIAMLMSYVAQAQYTGGVGRGDARGIFIDQRLSFLYLGGSGRGDVKDMKPASRLSYYWTGTLSTGMDLGANWNTGSFPAGEYATVGPNAVRMPITRVTTTTVTANTSIVVLPGATLTVAPNNTLTVNAGAKLLNKGGAILVKSDSSGTGSIGYSQGIITGNITVQQYIPANARRWRFLSSPVSDATLEDWRKEIFITGNGTGNTIGSLNSAGFDATQNNSNGVYYYNEAAAGVGSVGWVLPTSATSSLINVPLVKGRGYRVFIRGDRSSLDRLRDIDLTQNAVTIDVTGNINSGDIVMPVSYTNTNNGGEDGWNLLGNPYPSAYNWRAFYNANVNRVNIDPIIYTYDPRSNSYYYYNALTQAGNLTNGVIAASQSFFIRANGNAPSLTLSETYKTSASAIRLFKNEPSVCAVKLIQDSMNSDEMMITYLNEATVLNDIYDAPKMATRVAISAIGSDRVSLSLSARPVPANADTIYLSVVAPTTGSYTMQFENVNAIDALGQVSLIDNFTATEIDLKQSANYTFQADVTNPSTYGDKRFYILVANAGSLPVTLLSFNAKATSQNKVKIDWETAKEEHVSSFEIEHSSDNVHFSVIGTQKAAGNTSVLQSYHFTDESPLPLNYYRLRTIDDDGQYAYSRTRIVRIGAQPASEEQVLVYPNTFDDRITVESGEVNLKLAVLYNITGTEVAQFKLDGNKQELQIPGLDKGVYLLHIVLDNGTSVTRKVVCR